MKLFVSTKLKEDLVRWESTYRIGEKKRICRKKKREFNMDK